MLTKFEEFDNYEKEPEEITKIIDDLFLQYEHLPIINNHKLGLLCLEAYWNMKLGDDLSIQPWLDSLSGMIEKKFQVLHRRIDSIAALNAYTNYPDGAIFKNQFPEENIQIIFLAMHGQPGKLMTVTEDIDSLQLINAFKNYGRISNKLIFFGSCSVFEGAAGQEFAREFIEKTGVHSIVGFSQRVRWVDSLVINMLFLARFFADNDPFNNLQKIYKSVVDEYLPATGCGFSLFMNNTK